MFSHSFFILQLILNKASKSQSRLREAFLLHFTLFFVLLLTFYSNKTNVYEDVIPQLKATVENSKGNKLEDTNKNFYKSIETSEETVETSFSEKTSHFNGIPLFTNLENEVQYFLINREHQINKYNLSQYIAPLKSTFYIKLIIHFSINFFNYGFK